MSKVNTKQFTEILKSTYKRVYGEEINPWDLQYLISVLDTNSTKYGLIFPTEHWDLRRYMNIGFTTKVLANEEDTVWTRYYIQPLLGKFIPGYRKEDTIIKKSSDSFKSGELVAFLVIVKQRGKSGNKIINFTNYKLVVYKER